MEQLIRRAKRKDGEAFVELMELHMQCMYKIAWNYLQNDEEAADAVQETILSCYEKIGTLKNDSYFKTWMIRILINKCNDVLRQRQRYADAPEEYVQPYVETGYAETEWQQILNSLDEKYRNRKVVKTE